MPDARPIAPPLTFDEHTQLRAQFPPSAREDATDRGRLLRRVREDCLASAVAMRRAVPDAGVLERTAAIAAIADAYQLALTALEIAPEQPHGTLPMG